MSWSSRFGEWASGRFSPFARPNANQQVTEDDYSYITADDLHHHQHGHHDHDHNHDHSPRRHERPVRETDVVVVRLGKISYPIHFPSYSIDDGALTIGDVRKEAAKRLDTLDFRRIRMFYKGKNLKDDRRMCRDEGFRSDSEVDVLCVIGEKAIYQEEAESLSGSESGPGVDDVDRADAKRRDRNRKRNNRKRRSDRQADTDGRPAVASSPSAQTVEHLPVPSGSHPLHRTQNASSRSPSPAGSTRRSHSRSSATPQTPIGKLNAIRDTFHDELLPQCLDFTRNPPSEGAKRKYEHKRLTETVLAQVLLKLDGVEAEGDDEVRTRRKELVKEAQGWLSQLDAVMK